MGLGRSDGDGGERESGPGCVGRVRSLGLVFSSLGSRGRVLAGKSQTLWLLWAERSVGPGGGRKDRGSGLGAGSRIERREWS